MTDIVTRLRKTEDWRCNIDQEWMNEAADEIDQLKDENQKWCWLAEDHNSQIKWLLDELERLTEECKMLSLACVDHDEGKYVMEQEIERLQLVVKGDTTIQQANHKEIEQLTKDLEYLASLIDMKFVEDPDKVAAIRKQP